MFGMNPGKNGIVTLSHPRSIASEQYRILAMKVQQQLGDDSAKVVAVTSASGGEGKTTTAINLSIALSGAIEGRVLLVDSDLRKPRIHQYLDFKPSGGFSDLLTNQDDDIYKYAWKMKDLYVIPGKSNLSNPVGALASNRARALFARLRQEFRLIVIDSPPILPIADSHILAGLADGVIIVVRARRTPRELFQRALESFDAANMLGVVLNDLDYQHSRYAYAYEYYKKNYLVEH